MAVENQSEGFPVGMPVLAVDDDSISLKCHYHDKADHKKILGKRRKDQDGDNDDGPSSSQKKPRVVWSVDLHRKFVAAVNQLGLDNAVPKKILHLMNVEGLTRENVASHLQKYKLHLKKVTQQASKVAALGDDSDSSFRMGAIDGYADFYSSSGSGSGRIPSTTLLSYAPGGNFGLLNSPAGLNLRKISSSAALFRPVQSQNISSCSLSKIANIQPSMFPSNQSSNLLPGISTSIELNQYNQNSCNTTSIFQLNQIESSGFAVASSFPNSSLPYVSSNDLMIQESSQQTHNAGAFSNQSSAGVELFDTGICASFNYLLEDNWCTEIWQTGAQLLKFPACSLQECVDTFSNNCDSPVDSSSSVVNVVPLEDARNELRCQEGLIANIVQPSSFTPIELNQSNQNSCWTTNSGFAVASSFPNSNANSSLPYVSSNHLMIQENSQQTHNTGAFSNQSSAGTELFDTGIYASSNYLLEDNWCTEIWQSGAHLPKFPASVDTFNNVCNSPADSSSSSVVSAVPLEDVRNELRCQEGLIANIVQPSSFTPRQSWEGHKPDYNQNMSRAFNLETRLYSTLLMRWSQF